MSEGILSSPETETTPENSNTNLPGQNTNTASNFDFVPENIRNEAWIQKYDSPEKLWDGIQNMQKLVGQKTNGIPIPEDGDDSKWDEVYKKLGKPESADQYTLEAKYYDEENYNALKGEFATFAHKHGLTNKQASGLFNDYVEQLNQAYEATKIDPESIIKEAFPKDTEKNLGLAKRGASMLGYNLRELDESGATLNPHVLKILSDVAQRNKEDSAISSNSSPARSKADILREAKEIQKSASYRNDPSMLEKVNKLYEEAYTL